MVAQQQQAHLTAATTAQRTAKVSVTANVGVITAALCIACQAMITRGPQLVSNRTGPREAHG